MVEGTLNLAFVMFTLTEALSKAYEMLTGKKKDRRDIREP